MRIAAQTDIGLVRKRNEDYFIVEDSHDLVVLCDGMGGHPGGDIASRLAAEVVRKAVVENLNDGPRIPNVADDELKHFVSLLQGVFQADRSLRDFGNQNPEYQGMGTTLVALQEKDGFLCVAHVGDSRVYQFKNGRLQQVTHDHSVVANHPEYAHLAGMRNILTRAMGVGDELEVDFTIVPARKGEIYLLCTDGLHNYVEERRIAEVLATDQTLEQRIKMLIEDAKKGGGGDNITLSLVSVEDASNGEARRISGVIREKNDKLFVQLEPED